MNDNATPATEDTATLSEGLSEAIQQWQNWLVSEDFYVQAIVVAACFLGALLLVRLAAKRVSPEREKLEARSQRKRVLQLIRSFAIPLLAPLLAILFLATTLAISQELNFSADLLRLAAKMAWLWFILRLVRLVVKDAVTYTIVLVVLVPAAAFYVLGILDPVSDYLDSLGFTAGEVRISALTLVKGLLIFALLLWLGRLLSGTADRYIRRQEHINASTRKLFSELFTIAMYFILALVGMNMLGIDITALAVFGGALGVGIGFGLQKIASNFISGIILLIERSVKEGDLIQLEDGVMGHVRNLGARATLVESFDGEEIMIPNEEFIVNRSVNWTYSNMRARVQINVGVAYGTDLGLVKQLLLEAAHSHPLCIEEPAPGVFLREFGDNSINFLLTLWIDNINDGRMGVQSDVMYTIWDKFKESGIEIPFPQRDVYLRSVPKSMTTPSPVKTD